MHRVTTQVRNMLQSKENKRSCFEPLGGSEQNSKTLGHESLGTVKRWNKILYLLYIKADRLKLSCVKVKTQESQGRQHLQNKIGGEKISDGWL